MGWMQPSTLRSRPSSSPPSSSSSLSLPSTSTLSSHHNDNSRTLPHYPRQQQRHHHNDERVFSLPSFIAIVFTIFACLLCLLHVPVVSSLTTSTSTAPSQVMGADPLGSFGWRPNDERFFFPSECFDATNRSCCPISNGLTCGGVGTCTNITTSDNVCDMTNGWRGLWWFTTWFDFACVCTGNRTGAACEKCMPGYSGDDCDVQVEVVDRKDFSSLSTIDKEYVMDAFRLAKVTGHPYQTNVSLFDWVAALHRWSLPGITVINTTLHPWALEDNYATSYSGGHAGSGAITWHRSLTVAMEYALQVATGNQSFAMPYWNWTSSLLGDQDDTLKWFGGDGDSLSREDEGQYCRSRSPVHSTVQLCNCYMTRGAFAQWPLVGDWGIALNDTIMRAFGCQTLWGPSIPEAEVERFVVTVPYYDDWVINGEITEEADRITMTESALAEADAIWHEEFGVTVLANTEEYSALPERLAEIAEETAEDRAAGIMDPADAGATDVTVLAAVHDSPALVKGAPTSVKQAIKKADTTKKNTGWDDVHMSRRRDMAKKFGSHDAAAVRSHLARKRVHARVKTPANLFTNDEYSSTHDSTFHDILGGGYPGSFASWPSAEKPTDLHERIHRWVGGTILGEHPASDPLFWLLHGYADLILERWLRNAIATGTFGVDDSWGDTAQALSHARYECQAPFFPLRTHISVWTNSKQLGFNYDFFDGQADNTAEVFYENDLPTAMNTTTPLIDVNATIPGDESFFVPSECSVESRTLCVVSEYGECGGSERGTCVNITDLSNGCDVSTNPSNLWWITGNFDSVCECVIGYKGHDCGECQVGYSGFPNCTQDSLYSAAMRQDFSSLTTLERQQFVDGLVLLKMLPSRYQPGVSAFDFHAATYRWGMSGVPQPNITLFPELADVHMAYGDGEHGALTWRRMLLMRLESDLRLVLDDPSFALPYWKWTSTSGNNNDAAIRWMGGDGDTAISDPYRCRIPDEDGRGGCNCSLSLGVFTEWTEIGDFGEAGGALQRGFACLQAVAPSLPTELEVEYALSLTTFDSGSEVVTNIAAANFARTLTGLVYEGGISSWPSGDNLDADARAGLSRRVQNWIGGTSTSWAVNPASDPLFWMHLTYTDLIFERWLRANVAAGETGAEKLWTSSLAMGHNRDECMGAFVPLTRNGDMMQQSTSLGYDYDYFHPS